MVTSSFAARMRPKHVFASLFVGIAVRDATDTALRILAKLRQREDVVHDPFAVDAQCGLRKKRSKRY